MFVAGSIFAGALLVGPCANADPGYYPMSNFLAMFSAVPRQVEAMRGGARLFSVGRVSNEVSVVVNNLTNRLYAEFSNASFFRPEPKRSLAVSWRTSF